MKNWKLAIGTWESNQKTPFVIKKVDNISEISDSALINELKRRGYTGNLNKIIDI